MSDAFEAHGERASERSWWAWLSRFFTEPRSLRRGATAARLGLREPTRWRRAGASALRYSWTVLSSVLRSGPTYFVIGVVGLWAPPLTDRAPLRIHDANDFVSTLWQVQAGALGLTLAVVIFAFQAISTSRWKVGLREFARGTFLLPVVFLGSTSLFIDGMVLLGWGRGGVEGWAATWATVLGAATLLSVPFLFALVLREIDPVTLRTRTIARLSEAVTRRVEQGIDERLAVGQLDAWCTQVGADHTWFLRAQPWHVAVSAKRPGEIRDVRLRMLRRLAEVSSSRGANEAVHISARPGQPVSSGDALLLLPSAATEREKKLGRKVVRVGKARKTDRLEDAFDELHVLAVGSARNGDAREYSDIRDAYITALTAFPAAWRAYGQAYDVALAGGNLFFGLGDLDRIKRDVVEQLRQALAANQRELAGDIAYLPVRAASAAVGLGAHGLATQMLELLVSMGWAVEEYAGNPAATLVDRQVPVYLAEFVEYHASSRIERSELAIEDRREAGRFVEEGLKAVADYVKFRLDRHRHDGLDELLERVDGVLRYFSPDPRYFEFDLRAAQQAEPAKHAEIAAAEEALAEAHALKEIADRIDETRRRYLFELASWSLRLLRTQGSAADLLRSFQVLAARTGNDRQRVEAASQAIEGERLSNWILFTLPSGRAHAIGSDGLAVDAFVVITLLRNDGVSKPDLDDSEWVADRANALIDAAEGLIGWPLWDDLLTGGNASERIERFIGAVRLVVDRVKANRQAALIAAQPVEPQVEQFIDWISTGYEGARLERILTGVEASIVPRDEAGDLTFPGLDRWLSKGLFLQTNTVGGLKEFARSMGEGVAEVERDLLLDELLQARRRRLPAGDLLARLDAAVALLEAEGFEPDLLVTPINWRLRVEMKADQLDAGDPRCATVGERARHWLYGRRGPLLLLDSPTLPADRMVVLDSTRHLELRRTRVEPEGKVFVATIEFYSLEKALASAKAHPSLFRTDEQRSRRARAEAIAGHALLHVRTAVHATVRDANAAISIAIPKALRDD